MAKKGNTLTAFEGRDVLSSTVAIRNAGDGLSKAMSVDPVELHQDQIVYVVIECEVEKIRFDRVPKTEGLERVHMLKAGRATLIDKSVVDAELDAQQRRIDDAAAAAKAGAIEGDQPIPFEGDPTGGGDSAAEAGDVAPDA